MSGRSKPWCAMPRSTAPMPRHEFSQERSAPSTGRPASTRAASSVTRSRRPSWSVTAGGLAGQHALLDHLVRSEQKLPRPPEAGGPAHERSGQGRGTDPSRSLTIERPEGEHREHRTAPSEGKRPLATGRRRFPRPTRPRGGLRMECFRQARPQLPLPCTSSVFRRTTAIAASPTVELLTLAAS